MVKRPEILSCDIQAFSFPPLSPGFHGPMVTLIGRIHARQTCRLNRFRAIKRLMYKRVKRKSVHDVCLPTNGNTACRASCVPFSLQYTAGGIDNCIKLQALVNAKAYRQGAIARWKQKHLRFLSGSSRLPKRASLNKVHTSVTLEDVSSKADVLDSVAPCLYCRAIRMVYEPPSFCCSIGKVSLPPVSLPDTISDLLYGTDPESKRFRACIRTYNNHLAFTSLGATCDEALARKFNGIYVFRVQGQIYHYMEPLIRSPDRKTNLEFYIFDTEYELSHRLAVSPHLYEMTLERILTVLEVNPYARFFRSLGTLDNLDYEEIVLYCNPSVDQRVYNMPTASQVAGILVDGEPNLQKSIKVYSHSLSAHSVQYYYGCYDPLQYPLMFPYGQLGWHQGILKKNVELTDRKKRKYVHANSSLKPCNALSLEQLLHDEDKVHEEKLEDPNCVSMRAYYAYKLQIRNNDSSGLLHFGRLFQQYVVDMFVKIESQRLDYFKTQQNNIRQDFLQGITDAIASGETDCGQVGQRVVLPSTFTGGPRYMRKKYMDAMTLVRKFGKPDFFITMTCNPNWLEIKELLKEGESAQDRPDLVVRVFRAKIEELKKLLFKENIFGKVAAYTYVIEFQKRGLPHAHFLLILKPHYKIYRPEEFDKFVSAELPDPRQYPHLHRLVVKHMLHGPCGQLNPKNVCMDKKGFCKNHYPKDFCEETTAANDSYPSYRRRDNGDSAKARGHA